MRLIRLTILLLCLGACAPLIADYSLESYKYATSLKAETEGLIDKSGRPYSSARPDIEALVTKINVAYEFAAGQPNNAIATQEWQLIRDPDGTLLGAFLTLWRQQGTLSPGFRAEMKQQLDEAFDQLICLEANKRTGTSCRAAAAAARTASPVLAGAAIPARP